MEGQNIQKETAELFSTISKSFARLAEIMRGEASEDSFSTKAKGKSTKSSKSEKSKNEKAPKGKKQKKSKAEKDPNAPKKPLTAFMLYTNKRREEVMKENPGLKITEISSIIGREWKELTEEEKDIWKEKHNDAKLIYELNVFNYKKGKGQLVENEPTYKSKSKGNAEGQKSAMKTMSGKKRKKYSEDGSSIESSSEEEEIKPKRHKAK
ncbi:unnamed protein product [Moneuplotes crassus]|uniref:HMG box domain-containing protein n=1 Tax=Euplotes crassus TaxID=5936 RepID=A0AAD1UIG5_EUPCR|nr:unnamed protein product [Moneuplotes crassus]